MLLLQNAAKFTKESSDLKSIYLTFIRPVLEQLAPVWHSSLSQENISDLEIIQKSAVSQAYHGQKACELWKLPTEAKSTETNRKNRRPEYEFCNKNNYEQKSETNVSSKTWEKII